jgi:hypothetical protein
MNIDTFHYLDTVRKVALHMPEAEEYICYGTPAFRVKKKLMARIREDGKTLAIHSEEREAWMKKDPDIFFITDHYRNYPMLLVNLSLVKHDDLKTLFLDAWKQIAPKRLLKEYINTNQ